MADINIERRAPSVWPWVIGLLVLALLIWALVEMFGDASEPVIEPMSDTVTVEGATVTQPPTAPPASIGALPGDTGTLGSDPAGLGMDTAAAGANP